MDFGDTCGFLQRAVSRDSALMQLVLEEFSEINKAEQRRREGGLRSQVTRGLTLTRRDAWEKSALRDLGRVWGKGIASARACRACVRAWSLRHVSVGICEKPGHGRPSRAQLYTTDNFI